MRTYDSGERSGAIPPRLGLSLPLALGLLTYLVGLASGGARLDDPDVMLHIVTGRWIIAHRAVPHVDFLSYTFAGRPWVAHEWLGEIVTASCYDLLGWHGLVAMASLGLGSAVAILARALLGYCRPAAAIVMTCAAWFAVTPHWLARPHILALPLLVLWTALLVRARQEDRVPSRRAALLMVPWVNLHGTFLVGIGFTGLFMVEAILLAKGEARRVEAAKQWSLFAALAILASLVTPNGIEAYLLPLRLMDMKFALSVLLEWKAVNFQTMSTLEIWLLAFLGVVLFRGVALSLSRVLMTLLLFAMSLQHARNTDLLVFMTPLIVAPEAGPQLAQTRGRQVAARLTRWLDRLTLPATARGWALAGAVLVAGEVAALAVPVALDDRYAPAKAVEAVLRDGITGPVLNAYDYGDYLLFAGVKTFIDGRADMYGDAFIKRYYDATRGRSDDLPALLRKYHVAWTIFPRNSPAVVQLDRMKEWNRLYADDVTVVHVRKREAAGRR